MCWGYTAVLFLGTAGAYLSKEKLSFPNMGKPYVGRYNVSYIPAIIDSAH